MKNVISFDQFNEGLFNVTPEKWWNYKRSRATDSKHLRNKEYFDLFTKNYTEEEKEQLKKDIEDMAKQDHFKGEVVSKNGKIGYGEQTGFGFIDF